MFFDCCPKCKDNEFNVVDQSCLKFRVLATADLNDYDEISTNCDR